MQMFDTLRDSFELLQDHVWFFRFFLVICVVCAYRTLLHYVLKSNTCPNPFCRKCLGTGSVRGRAIGHLKKISPENDDDNSVQSNILGNLLRHDHLCHRNDEKPTVYFHRGLSSVISTLADQKILVEHFDEIRREVTKFVQENDENESKKVFLFQTGEENENQCEKFPKLSEILRLLPNAICVANPHCIFGNAFLTNFDSAELDDENVHGLSNCVVRLHFGLICDDQSAAFVRLNKLKRLPIKTKDFVVYNDAIEHSIENPQEKRQIFLTIDFWHPDLSASMRKELTSIFHTDLV